jgi:hypothetical protein
MLCSEELCWGTLCNNKMVHVYNNLLQTVPLMEKLSDKDVLLYNVHI